MAETETDEPSEGDGSTSSRRTDGDGSGPTAEQQPEDPGTDSPDESKPETLPGEGTPEGDSLREALAAFERGDYVCVRELTEKLLEVPDDEVARYARELMGRTRVDPVQIGVVIACLALFGYIVYTYVL